MRKQIDASIVESDMKRFNYVMSLCGERTLKEFYPEIQRYIVDKLYDYDEDGEWRIVNDRYENQIQSAAEEMLAYEVLSHLFNSPEYELTLCRDRELQAKGCDIIITSNKPDQRPVWVSVKHGGRKQDVACFVSAGVWKSIIPKDQSAIMAFVDVPTDWQHASGVLFADREAMIEDYYKRHEPGSTKDPHVVFAKDHSRIIPLYYPMCITEDDYDDACRLLLVQYNNKEN
jgi:hypothetical protein